VCSHLSRILNHRSGKAQSKPKEAKRSTSFVVFGLAAAAIYLAVANRQLTSRLSQAEKSVQQWQQLATGGRAEADAIQTRRIPRRFSPPNSGQPPKPDQSSENRPAPEEPADLALETVRTSDLVPARLVEVQTVVVAPAAGLLPPIAVAEPEWVRYVGREGSHIVVEGTSNIHDWRLESKIVAGQLSVAPGLDFDHRAALAEFPTNLPCSATAVIPIRSLKSESPRMDQVMQNILEMTDFPTIRYELRTLSFNGSASAEGASNRFESLGDLMIHGVAKQVAMPVKIELDQGGRLSATLSVNLKMTDFGIAPPQSALAMGVIRTGDDLRITLDWKLERVQRSKSPPPADLE
jgi:YceI-like domain